MSLLSPTLILVYPTQPSISAMDWKEDAVSFPSAGSMVV